MYATSTFGECVIGYVITSFIGLRMKAYYIATPYTNMRNLVKWGVLERGEHTGMLTSK